MLINAYCTHRKLPVFEFPHELIGSRDLSDPELVDHLNGFIGFIMQGGEREMTQTLYHVYRHIERVQNHLSLEVEEDHLDAFAAWAWDANAIIFLQDGSVCDPNGNVLVSPEDGGSDPEAQIPYPDDALERKEVITQDLQELKLEPYEGLPPVVGEQEVDLRPAQEVARRAIALMAVAIRAESLASNEPIPVDEIRERLPQAFDVFSPVEQAFMNDDSPDQQSIINHAWRYECLYVLEWALGHFDELHFPSAICDVPEVAGDILKRDREEMIAQAQLRPTHEILDEVDLHFRLHWIARQANEDGEPAPAGLDIGVIHERRVALNWLTQFENADWDDVDCPT